MGAHRSGDLTPRPSAPTRRPDAPLATRSLARLRRRPAVIASAMVVAGAVLAGPVLAAGQPTLSTADADRAAADRTAIPAVEVDLLDGLAEARDAAGAGALEEHPEAARLARDWSQVMASVEDDEALASCADLYAELPGPVWHPEQPHADLAHVYSGDIGEVVGCFANEVDAAAFLANRLADEAEAGLLLDDDFAYVGIGAVAADSEATFTAIVLLEPSARQPDRRGIDALLERAVEAAPDARAGVLVGAGPAAELMAGGPLARGEALGLATDRPTNEEVDPVLASRVRHQVDQLDPDRLLLMGGERSVSARTEAELRAAGLAVERIVASGFGADPDRPVVVHDDADAGVHAPAIAALLEARIMTGREDGFAPSLEVRRDQVATVLARTLGLPAAAEQPFDDLAGNVHAEAIAAAAAAGLVQGFGDGRFGPAQPVTRGQLAAMLDRTFELPPADGDAPFSDVAGTTHATSIANVAEAGIIAGFNDGTFRPSAPSTRAQTASMVLYALLLN